MNEAGRIQIPKDKAELAAHACLHFEDNFTESVFYKSIRKFIKEYLPAINADLYKKCGRYNPSPQNLFRAIGMRDPGYSQKRSHLYLSQILDHYIAKFETDFPEQVLLYKQEKAKEKASSGFPGNSNSPETKSIINFGDYIDFKSDDFTGREWLFEKLFSLIRTGRSEAFYRSAYLLIHGDPGIGKTAIIAQLVKKHQYAHHFNIQNEGINTASLFLNNICAQLVQQFGLPESFASSDQSMNSILLQQVLKAVSKQVAGKNEPCIILVDAIDEVKAIPGETNNILFLPDTLPEDIYFILSAREPDQLRLPRNSRLEKLPITGNSKENIADAKAWLTHIVKKKNIQSYLARHKVDKSDFLSILLERSEGNFIYLYHVIREISAGIYSSASLEELPQGLQQYYEEHWRFIKGDDNRKWIDYRLSVLAILAVAELPVDITFISNYSVISKTADIIEALTIWLPFLHKNDNKYSLYHKSFRDFLLLKDQVKGEALDLRLTRKGMIAKMKKDMP